MNGILAQTVAIAAYGNDFLKKGRSAQGFYPQNSTFKFCNTVDFREFSKALFSDKIKEEVVAKNPADWFKQIKKDGCMHLRLYLEPTKDPKAPDHKLAGFVGGGGSWLIEAVYKKRSNYWVNKWEVGDQNAPDQKIWMVKYGLIWRNHPTRNLQIDLEDTKGKLRQALTEISAFAYEQSLENWGRLFDKAYAILDSDDPGANYYHQDLVPTENYSLAARQALFAAGAAWVFGGMGSWNDMSYQDVSINERYEHLSAQLYTCINEAIIAAINSY